MRQAVASKADSSQTRGSIANRPAGQFCAKVRSGVNHDRSRHVVVSGDAQPGGQPAHSERSERQRGDLQGSHYSSGLQH